jgi:class 3 adenylate cyclase/predicted ATPase
VDIEGWLRELGLERYAQAFRDNEIDADILPTLTAEDLKDLGVTVVGHRRKLLNAIDALRGEPQKGADPAAGSGSPGPAEDVAPRSEAERRQLTVMFVDLVGSTALSARLDPEDMRDVIRAYQDTVAGAIVRFEGHVARFMGDGVLAYFGWPRAHEDEAERAARAGLAITEGVAALPSPEPEPLAARVGIATGLVVVGDLIGEAEAQERAVVGETPNLAARLQGLAEPGKVVVSEATARLVEATFDLHDMGSQAIKGLEQSVRVFTIRGERSTPSRFEARSGPSLSPMVGRDQELALLQERWGHAKAGEGQAVLLVGEAGIGKSRISRALIDTVVGEPHAHIHYQCSPYHTDSALWPVTRQLTHAADLTPEDSPDGKLDKLEGLLRQAADDVSSIAPLFASLIGLDGETRYGRLDLSPELQRARTLEALIDQLIGLAARQPVLVLFEDVHWIDPTMLELIGQALDRIAAARVLFVLTSRPDGQPQLAAHPHVTRLTLNRLGRAGVEAIVARLADGGTLPTEMIDAIIARTDGVPLFVEELTKAVIESGATSELSIPASLHDSLMARLDRIPEVKEVAQVAACIGREFGYRLLASVAPLPEARLQGALERLAGSELVFRRGSPPDATYTFKHALVRDAAYESLLKSRRSDLHAHILAALEDASAPGPPEILAHHATQAGLVDKAIDYWRQAGEAAIARSAYVEAMAQLDRGIALVRQLDDGSERQQRELALLVSLGQASIASHGYGNVKTVGIFDRARRLVQGLGETPLRFPAYYGVWAAHHVRAEMPEALARASEFLEIASRQNDDSHSMMARRLLGTSQAMMGKFPEARDNFEKSWALYDPERHQMLAVRFGHEPGVGILCYGAINLWCLGFADQASRMTETALDIANRVKHTNTLAYAQLHVALLLSLMRRFDKMAELVASMLEISAEHGLKMWEGFALSTQSPVQFAAGDPANALATMERALKILEATDTWLFMPYRHAFYAGTLAALGRFEDALREIDVARRAVEDHGELWFWPEIRRLEGDILLRRPGYDAEQVEDAFHDALSIARGQQAKSWELRAAMSLAQLWAGQGERRKARDLLAPIYGGFTEGLDTPDLKDAKALLDELK